MENTKAALNEMPPILLCLPTTSEADGGGAVVEAEPSHQYSVTFCCYVTDGSRRAIWQNGVWPGNVYEVKVWNWIPLCRKNGTRWHSLMLAECFWRPNSRREHSEAVGGVFQQWQQWHERQAMFWMVMHSCQTMIWSIYLSTNCWFTTGNCVQSWISAILCWKEMMVAMLEYQSLHKVGPLNSHTEQYMQVCQDLLNQYEADPVSWIASLPFMRCGITTISWSQNGSTWSGNTWIPHQRKRCSLNG